MSSDHGQSSALLEARNKGFPGRVFVAFHLSTAGFGSCLHGNVRNLACFSTVEGACGLIRQLPHRSAMLAVGLSLDEAICEARDKPNLQGLVLLDDYNNPKIQFVR